MKIDVIDFSPHINGMTTYGRHAAEGLRALGHDCQLVSFTKSGKPPEAWSAPSVAKHAGRASHVTVERVVKWSDMTDYLRTLDGAVLNEPRNTILDNRATKDFDDPPYMRPFIDSKTPWTCMIGCPQYTPDYAPFLESFVDQTNVRGIIAAFPSFVPNCFIKKEGMRVVFSNKYPYTPVMSGVPSDKTLCVAGRLAGNKGGWTSLFAVIDKLPTDWGYEVWGSCGRGLGPSTVVQMIEALRAQYGCTYFRWDAGDPQQWQPFRTDPFTMQLKTGHVVSYKGGFLTPPFKDQGVVLNLSSASFTTGTIEYIGLEALDAGCTLVTADHLNAGDECYDILSVEHEENASMSAKGFKMRSDWVPLVDAIKSAMCDVDDDAIQHEAVAFNRTSLKAYHDPRKHAELLVTCLAGGKVPSTVSECAASSIPDLIANDTMKEARWNPRMRRKS